MEKQVQEKKDEVGDNEEWSVEDWERDWESKASWAHNDVTIGLKDNMSELTNDEPCTFFVPMCADMYDMKWLHDHGHTVIGVDIVEKAIRSFLGKYKFEYSVKDIAGYGKVYKSKDGRLILYAGDVFQLTGSFLGTGFDVICDSGGIQALHSKEWPRYIDFLNGLMKPTGCIFMNLMGEDIPDDAERVPPYFQTAYEKLVSMFTVERVSRYREVWSNDEGLPEWSNSDMCVINNFYTCRKIK